MFRLLHSWGKTSLFPPQMMMGLTTASANVLTIKHPLSLPRMKARPPSHPVHILATTSRSGYFIREERQAFSHRKWCCGWPQPVRTLWGKNTPCHCREWKPDLPVIQSIYWPPFWMNNLGYPLIWRNDKENHLNLRQNEICGLRFQNNPQSADSCQITCRR